MSNHAQAGNIYQTTIDASDYQDLQSSTEQQENQLNARSLLPGNWGSNEQPSNDGWGDHAPNRQQFERSFKMSADPRAQQNSRQPNNKLGQRNLLRTQPAVPLTKDSGPWWNDSSFRQDLLTNNRNGSALNGFSM